MEEGGGPSTGLPVRLGEKVEGFAQLLLLLREEHEREVAGLRRTIEDLLRGGGQALGSEAHSEQARIDSRSAIIPLGDNFVADLRENTSNLDDIPKFDEDLNGNVQEHVNELKPQKVDVPRSDEDLEVNVPEQGNETQPRKMGDNEFGLKLKENLPKRDGPLQKERPVRNSMAVLVAKANSEKGHRSLARLQKATLRYARLWLIFDATIGICILLNMAFIFLRLEYNGYITGRSMGVQQPGKWPHMDGFFVAMQYIFCAIFLTELIVRLAIHKRRFFCTEEGALDRFNLLDLVIVVVTLCDLLIVAPLAGKGTGASSDLTALRVIRCAKMLRSVQMIRTVEMFSKLRVLCSTVAASFYALFWSVVLLFVCMMLCAFVLTELVSSYLRDHATDPDLARWMYRYYGSAGRALWTLFEVTFSGGWPTYARRLVEEGSITFALIYVVYITFVVFAMTRIITALFLKDTLAAAASDAEIVIQERTRERRAYAAKLLEVFHAADVSGEGILTIEEFESCMKDSQVKTYLASLELDTHETRNLFNMLDDGDGAITAEEFVRGAMRLKGGARSQDVVAIMHDFHVLNRKVTGISKRLEDIYLRIAV